MNESSVSISLQMFQKLTRFQLIRNTLQLAGSDQLSSVSSLSLYMMYALIPNLNIMQA